jgi:hypothetical protein
MTIGNLGTNLFSESIGLLGGTLSRMSPELMNASRADSKMRATCESDCYALGMMIYEVSRLRLLWEWPPIDLSKVLTRLRPFHGLSIGGIVLAVLAGERPGKPCEAESLGFSDSLWELVQMCWSKEGSDRPSAQRLVDHLFGVFEAWDPPMDPAIESGIDSDSSSLFKMSLENSTSGV